ncbi:MAG: methyltransferase type 11, partial [Acidobacteria bacterium]
MIATGDAYKDQVQRQWNHDPAGSHYVTVAPAHTQEWFLEAEHYRYGSYAPWMAETMEFDRHNCEKLLEIGGGMGTDLAQFARHGARVTDVDLSAGHLRLARENFAV